MNRFFHAHHEPVRILAENAALPLHVFVATTHAYTLAALAAGVIAIAYLISAVYQARARQEAHHE